MTPGSVSNGYAKDINIRRTLHCRQSQQECHIKCLDPRKELCTSLASDQNTTIIPQHRSTQEPYKTYWEVNRLKLAHHAAGITVRQEASGLLMRSTLHRLIAVLAVEALKQPLLGSCEVQIER